jgi:hypothetical protein
MRNKEQGRKKKTKKAAVQLIANAQARSGFFKRRHLHARLTLRRAFIHSRSLYHSIAKNNSNYFIGVSCEARKSYARSQPPSRRACQLQARLLACAAGFIAWLGWA